MADLDSFRIGLRVPVETKEWLYSLASRSGVGPVGFFSQCIVLGARQLERTIAAGGDSHTLIQSHPPRLEPPAGCA
jgi:hypothetical protein